MKCFSNRILALCAGISLTLILWPHLLTSGESDVAYDTTSALEATDHEDSLPGMLDRGVRLFIGGAGFFD